MTLAMIARPVCCKRRQFPPHIIARAVRLCFRVALSLRLIEEMPLERGVAVSCETMRRWAPKFGADHARRLKRKRSRRHDIWRLDEILISTDGEKRYPWRALDQDG